MHYLIVLIITAIFTIVIEINSIDSAAIPSLLHWDQNIVLSESTPDGCMFNSIPYKIGEKWKPSLDAMDMFKCVQCECKEGNEGGYVFCKNLENSCKKLNCKKTIILEGECCPQCVIDNIKNYLNTLPEKVPSFELYTTLLHSDDKAFSTIVATSIYFNNKLHITINDANLAIRKIQLTDSARHNIYYETSSLSRIETKDGDSLNLIIMLRDAKLISDMRDNNLYLNIEVGVERSIIGRLQSYESTLPFSSYSVIFNIYRPKAPPQLATISMSQDQSKLILHQNTLANSRKIDLVYIAKNIQPKEGISIFPMTDRNNPNGVELRYLNENDIQKIFDNPTWLTVMQRYGNTFEGQIQARPLFRSWYTELRTTISSEDILLTDSLDNEKGWVKVRLIDTHTIEIDVFLDYSQLSITVIDVQLYINEDTSLLDLSDADLDGRISYTWTDVSWRDIDLLIKSQVKVVAYAVGEEEAKLGGILLPNFYFDSNETEDKVGKSHGSSTDFYSVEPQLDSSVGIWFYVPLIEKFRDTEIIDMLVVENGYTVIAEINYTSDENALEYVFEAKLNSSYVTKSSLIDVVENEISKFELIIRYRDSTGKLKGVNGGEIKLKVNETLKQNSLVSIELPQPYQNIALNETCVFNRVTYSYGDEWIYRNRPNRLKGHYKNAFKLMCKCSEFAHVDCRYSCNLNCQDCQAKQFVCSSNHNSVINDDTGYGCLDDGKYRTVNETWHRKTKNDEVCICKKSEQDSEIGQVECVKITVDCRSKNCPE